MRTHITCALAGMLIALSTTAMAGNKAEQFSISPIIGGYTFEGKQHLDTNPVYGVRAGYNFTKHFGVEALFDYLHTESTVNSMKADIFRYGGELLYHFMPDNKLVPYVAAGGGGVSFDGGTGKKFDRPAFDYGAGLKYFLNDSIALRADVRHIIYKDPTIDKTANNVEYSIGAYIPFGGAAPAAKPVEPPPAPPAPAPAPAPPKAAEPPAPPAPSSSLSVNPASVTKGQPTTLSWSSQHTTACDIQPGIGPVQTSGSMSVTPSDTTAYALSCSGPGGSTASAATANVVIPPPPAPPVVEAAQPKASAAAQRFCDKPAVLNVQFDTNKADIKPKFQADIDKLAEFLKEFPKAKGEISGHTDNVGSKEFNQKLSQRRADSVKTYIVDKHAIAAERITATGYGLTKPVASNKTAKGKAQNRRIEANFTCE